MAEFTVREQLILDKARKLMPENFSANTPNFKILSYAEVILADINFFPPLTNFTIESVPDSLLPILFFGISLFAELFFQMRATLEDFDYNDNGLYVRVDQVGKIDTSYRNMLEQYRHMIQNFKKTQIFKIAAGKGIGTPRFQSQIGQFLKIALGCVIPTTKLLTSNGWKLAAKMEKGDYILSIDGNYHEVYDIITRSHNSYIYIICVGRKKLSLTGNHDVFIVGKGWVPAFKIKAGDEIIYGPERSVRKVKSVSKNKYKGKVYDFSVKDSHSYAAEGVFVHNSAFTWNS